MMACFYCKEIERSHKEKPFPAPGGYVKEPVTYVCFICKQRWWCYNTFFCLWSMIEDDFTWDNIMAGGLYAIAIGNPSVAIERVDDYVRPSNFCDKRVGYPKLSVVEGPGGKILAVQWIGQYGKNNRGNIFSMEFQFHIAVSKYPGCADLEEAAKSYHVIYVGDLSEWPLENDRENLIKTGRKRDDCVVHLMSYSIPHTYPNGVGPTSFLADVILIGDPNVGVIRPKSHFDHRNNETVWHMFEYEQRKKV